MARPQQDYFLISFILLFRSVSQGVQWEQTCWLLVYTDPMLSAWGFLFFLSASCCFLAGLTLRPWRYRRYVPPIRRYIFIGLHGVQFRIICLSASWQVYYSIKKAKYNIRKNAASLHSTENKWQSNNERNLNQSSIFSNIYHHT
jgi:hypothetical protein